MDEVISSQANILFGNDNDFSEAVIKLTNIAGRDIIINHDFYDVKLLKGFNPYLGLDHFTYRDYLRFGGRDNIIDSTIKRIAQAGAEENFLIVMGTSGSGKSSFVQAGILPQLSKYYREQKLLLAWAVFRPGEHPIAAFTGALRSIGVDIAPGKSVDIRNWYSLMREKLPQRYIPCFVIDQFEEIFGARVDSSEKMEFIQMLTDLPTYTDYPFHIIITMRSDFLPELFDFPKLYEFTKDAINLRNMTPSELQQSIEKPITYLLKQLEQKSPELVQRIGPKKWEPELLERLREDANGDSAYLPLLQVTLYVLWEKGRLNLGSYKDLSSAIQEHVEEVWEYRDYDGGQQYKRTLDEQEIIKSIFIDLIDVSLDNNTTRDVRRGMPLELLISHDPIRSILVEDLVKARLLSKSFSENPDGSKYIRIDIVHESLLKNWSSLALFIEKERVLLQRRARFRDDLVQWSENGQILEGVRLASAIELRDRHDKDTLSSKAKDLINISISVRDNEQIDKLKRTRRFAISLLIFLVISIISTIFAVNRQNLAQIRQKEAERTSRISKAQALAAQANDQLDNDPELSILLAMEAISSTLSFGEGAQPESIESLHRALTNSPLRLTLQHTEDNVVDGDYSPDGSRIVTVGQEGIGKIWDAATGENILELDGHVFSLYDVDLSDDGSRIVASGDGSSIIVWDSVNGDKIIEPPENTSTTGFRSVDISPDGKKIIISGTYNSGDIEIFDIETLNTTMVLKGHKGYTFNAKFSPDGKKIISAGDDKTARIWNAETGVEEVTLIGHTDRVVGVAFSPKENIVATASWDNKVKIWDIQTGLEIRTLDGHTDRLRGVRFSPDGKLLLSSGWDKVARVWNVEDGGILFSLSERKNKITKAIFRPDGKEILVSDEDGIISFWKANNGAFISEIKVSDEAVQGISYTSDGKFIITTGIDGQTKLWNAESKTLVRAMDGRKPNLNLAVYSPDGTSIATAGFDNSVRLWDANTGILQRTLRGHSNLPSGISFSPDGLVLLTSDGFSPAKLWNWRSGKEIGQINLDRVIITRQSFSPDSKRVVGVFRPSSDSPLISAIFDIERGKIVQEFIGHTDSLFASVFSPDGMKVATASLDKTAKLWNANTGELLFTFYDHAEQVHSVAFSKDSNYLITTSADGTAKVWDTRNGSLYKNLIGHKDAVYRAVISPDGNYALTTAGDSRAYVWDIRLGSERGVSSTISGEALTSAIYSPDGQDILVVSNKSHIINSITGEIIVTLSEFSGAPAIYSPDGKTFATQNGNNTGIWDRDTLTITHRLKGFSPTYCMNGKYIITSQLEDVGNYLYIWDTKTYTITKTLNETFFGNSSITPACHPNGRYIAGNHGSKGIKDYKIVIWDIETMKVTRIITGHDNIIFHINYSPDGKYLASASDDDTAKIWDAETGELIKTLIGHNQAVTFVEFSPDGKSIVTSGFDGTVKVWDTESGQLIYTISDNKGAIVSASFSKDGKYIVTASRDGTLRQYYANTDELLEFSQNRVTRVLTSDERQQYLK